jgi:hypothetical protein
MGFFRGPNIVRDGLVLALDAASPRSYPGSGTTWYDLSGNGNNGTLVNSTFSNNVIQFDGTNDYVSVGNVGSNSIKTVICWFSMNNVNTNMALFGFGTAASNTQDVYMWGEIVTVLLVLIIGMEIAGGMLVEKMILKTKDFSK